MKILIIGCGYVGSAVATLWYQAGEHEVTVTTTREERLEELGEFAHHAYVFDSTDPASMPELLQNKDVVILSVGSKGRDSYRQCYLDTAEQLTATMATLANPPKQLVYTSSTSVYGNDDGSWVDEETPTSPKNPQTEILCQTEQCLLQKAPKKTQVCILRLAGIIGPGRDPRERAKRLAGQELAGNGANYINHIHRDAIVQAVNQVVERKLGGIFNLCGDEHPSREEYYDGICAELGIEPVRWNPALPSMHSSNKRISNAKAKAAGILS